jgi:hypothetical protein
MYGLRDEYLDSSIKVVPDYQHSTPSDTPASEMTIAEVAKQATLWKGDRLSLVYDYGTSSLSISSRTISRISASEKPVSFRASATCSLS